LRLVEKNWPLAKVRDLLNVSYLRPYLQNHVKKHLFVMQAIKYFYSWRKILICWMSILVIHFLCLWSLQNQESLVNQDWRNNHLHVDQQMMAFRKVQTLHLESMMSTNQWDEWSKVERNSCNCSCTMKKVKFVDNKCISITQGLGRLFLWAQCKRWNT